MTNTEMRLVKIPVDRVVIPEDRLRTLTSKKRLQDLAVSVGKRGVLVPILVEELQEGFRVIAGMRRVLAAQEAGQLEIAALVVDEGEEWKAWAMFTENVHREAVNAFDEGRYVTMLMAKLGKNQREVGELLGVSESWVSERLRIVEWPQDCQQALIGEQITLSVGKELSRIADSGTRAMYLRQAITSGCTALQAYQWRKQWEQELAARSKVGEGALLAKTVEADSSVHERCGICERTPNAEPLRVLAICLRCLAALEAGLRA